MSAPRLRRSNRSVGAVAIAALVAVTLTGCASSSSSIDSKAVGARVGTTVITVGDIERELHALEANKLYSKAANASGGFDAKGHMLPAFVAQWVTSIVTQVPIVAEFQSRHLKLSNADRATQRATLEQQLGKDSQGRSVFGAFAQWFQDRLVDRYATRTAVAKSLVKPVSEAAIQREYTSKYSCLSHILVATPAAADAIETDLAAGKDFVAIAKKQSTDTGSKASGGDLGCADVSGYVKEFAAAATAATIGKPTQPVHSQFGYHIILKRALEPISAAIHDQIKQALQGSPNQAFVELLNQRLTAAHVTVDRHYCTWTVKVTQQQPTPHCTPPKAGATGTASTVTAPKVVDERPTAKP